MVTKNRILMILSMAFSLVLKKKKSIVQKVSETSLDLLAITKNQTVNQQKPFVPGKWHVKDVHKNNKEKRKREFFFSEVSIGCKEFIDHHRQWFTKETVEMQVAVRYTIFAKFVFPRHIKQEMAQGHKFFFLKIEH